MIVERVAGSERPVRIAELVADCELPKATVHRICTLLKTQGYLRTDIGGRGLVPGPRLMALSDAVRANQAQFALRHAVLASPEYELVEVDSVIKAK